MNPLMAVLLSATPLMVTDFIPISQELGPNSYLAPGDQTAQNAKPSDLLLFGWTNDKTTFTQVEKLLRENHITFDGGMHLIYGITLEKRYANKARDLVLTAQKTNSNLNNFALNKIEIDKIK